MCQNGSLSWNIPQNSPMYRIRIISFILLLNSSSSRLFILLSTLLVFNCFLSPTQTFRPHILTSNAFKGGHDIDGEKLFICRSHKYGQIIPGKYSRSIRKCSITHNRREAQFHRYEILIESADKAYQWIELKKPVTVLPENVLFGGNKFGLPTTVNNNKKVNISSVTGNNKAFLLDAKDELKSQSVDLVLSSNSLWGSRKRRLRRSTTTTNSTTTESWSRNWRGQQLYEGVERITTFLGKKCKKRQPANNFSEVAVKVNSSSSNNSNKKKCVPKVTPNNLLLLLTTKENEQEDECLEEPQKANFYIAKCSLRTGNITSEQIGKIWWKEAIQEWVATFPFGGHEVPCFDYAVLTVKS